MFNRLQDYKKGEEIHSFLVTLIAPQPPPNTVVEAHIRNTTSVKRNTMQHSRNIFLASITIWKQDSARLKVYTRNIHS